MRVPLLILLLSSIFVATLVFAGSKDDDLRTNALVVADAVNKLNGQAVDYHTGVYSMLHEGGFSDSEIREFIRPILEKSGFSESSVVKYFNFFDPHYHGNDVKRIEEHSKIVDNLLN